MNPEGGIQHDPENLQFLARISRNLFLHIETVRHAPSDFLFDALLTLARTLRNENDFKVFVFTIQQAITRDRDRDSIFLF